MDKDVPSLSTSPTPDLPYMDENVPSPSTPDLPYMDEDVPFPSTSPTHDLPYMDEDVPSPFIHTTYTWPLLRGWGDHTHLKTFTIHIHLKTTALILTGHVTFSTKDKFRMYYPCTWLTCTHLCTFANAWMCADTHAEVTHMYLNTHSNCSFLDFFFNLCHCA